MHRLFWKPNNINALCWAFYYFNENKEINNFSNHVLYF